MKHCAPCLLAPLVLAACDASYHDHESTDEDTPIVIHVRGSSDPYLVHSPVHGTLSGDDKGQLRYQPDANFSGQDGFVYETDNGGLATYRTTVTIEVRPDDPPHEETRLVLPSHVDAVAPADMDGDGRIDLVAAGDVGTLVLLRNISEPDGPLAFEVTHAPAQSPASIGHVPSLAVADWNRDGIDDVIVVSSTSRPVLWLGGAKRAEALTHLTLDDPTVDTWVEVAATGDFDGDMEPDLALGDSQSLTVLFGVALDRDRLSDRSQMRRDMLSVSALQVIDLDGDGFDDLFVAGREPRITHGSKNRLGPLLSLHLDFDLDLLLSLHDPTLGAFAVGDEQWQAIDPETGQALPGSVRTPLALEFAFLAAAARWGGEEAVFIAHSRTLALQRLVGTPTPSLVPQGDIELEPGLDLLGIGGADLDGDGQDELWLRRVFLNDPTHEEISVLRFR